jgi:hypothetical protein
VGFVHETSHPDNLVNFAENTAIYNNTAEGYQNPQQFATRMLALVRTTEQIDRGLTCLLHVVQYRWI